MKYFSNGGVGLEIKWGGDLPFTNIDIYFFVCDCLFICSCFVCMCL